MMVCTLDRRIGISTGVYALLIVSLSIYIPLSIFTSVLKEGFNIYITRTLFAMTLYIDTIVIVIALAFAQVIKNVDVRLNYEALTEAVEGSEVAIKLRLEPQRISNLLKVVNVWVKSDMGLRSTRWSYSGSDRHLEIFLSGYPGLHKVQQIDIESSSILHLLSVRFTITFVKPIEVRIVPRGYGRRFNVDVVVPYPLLLEGRASRRKGVGAEVMGVREFVPDDDYRRIHWKATARTGKLMVKEYEQKIFRNAVIVVAIHHWFFSGEPPPLIFLFRLIIDVVETLTSMGMRIALGVVTEKDIKITELMDISRVYNVYKVLSEVEWPIDALFRYTSSNKVVRWFTLTIVEDICRDPCIVLLAIDPLDSIDIDNLLYISRILRRRKHVMKVLLTAPAILRFLYTSNVTLADVGAVESEIYRMKKVLSMFTYGDVYLPTAYLKP